MQKYWTILFCCFIGLTACQGQADTTTNEETTTTEEVAVTESTTIFLVRHAEKESGDDPALTEDGRARAIALAELLDRVEFDVIFSTDYKRTQLTAAPVASNKGLTVNSYNPRDLEGFAKTVMEQHAGQTILVVGHSNTTPTLTGILDGTKAHSPFDESDYGNLMLVTIPADGQAKTLRLRF